MKSIVITGGHHNSALVVAQEFMRQGYRVHWLGHRYTSLNDHSDSAEYFEVRSAKIKFYDLRAGKLGRSVSLQNILRIPGGLLQAWKYLRRIKPVAILSFGGYLGFAAAAAGKLLGHAVYLHEQTIVAGKSNRLVGLFAKRVFLTWESSRPFFSSAKSLVVGLPLRPSILSASRLKYFSNALSTLVIMGGKQGSHTINLFTLSHLSEILQKYNVLHQTGTNASTGDYAKALEARAKLPKTLQEHYQPVGYIGHEEIGTILRSADLYLGRSGGHITYELAVLGVAAVLIPYPHTHNAEQVKNARFLERAGYAVVVLEGDLNWQALLTATLRAQSLTPTPLALPTDAASRIVGIIRGDLKG